MSTIREGGCQCGAVRYEVSGEPTTVRVCHCTECQRQSGSAFGMTMIIARHQFALKRGELKAFTWLADSGTRMHGYFCPECGTRIYHQKERPQNVIALKPGTLDETSELAPTAQIWTRSRQHWFELPATLTSFETQPPA